ncbi:MAG: phosphotransferase family protein [Aquabacterium sp.]
MPLPLDLSPAAFDALHDEPAAWRDEVTALARQLGSATMQPFTEGTALVSRLDGGRILKVYPPFLADHFTFERALLARLHGRLALPTPQALADGQWQGWPYLVMTELAGTLVTEVWPGLDEPRRLALLHDLGRLAAQVHALPVGETAALAPSWPDFIARQRERCVHRQQRTRLPAHLLAQVPAFVAGPLPEGPDVLLTGEYTPFNLLAADGRLAGMFDFGDGLIGPREYDLLGPLCFLAAGHPARVAAFLDGYGIRVDADMRLRLMRLLLLHKYSALPLQVQHPGWEQAPDFEALAERIWPL